MLILTLLEMLFETTGWALPKNIAAQNDTPKKQKSDGTETSKEAEATKAADQLQAQVASLNGNATGKKNKKNKNKNKKRAAEEPAEETNKNKKVKQNNSQQKKKLQELLNKNKKTTAKPENESKKPAVEKKNKKQEAEKVAEKRKIEPKQDIDDGLTPLQRKMKEKLSGARFRWLNEQLYTTPGNKSFKLFQEKPELFDQVNYLYKATSSILLTSN